MPVQLTFAAAHSQAPFQLYTSQNRYSYRSGMYQMPTAGSAGPSDAARLHAPIGRRVYLWAVERKGLKPVLPHPETNDDNEELLSAEIVVHPVELDAGRVPVYFVEGCYVYALYEPRLHKNSLRMTAPPYLNVSASSLTYLESDFSKSIQ